MKWGVKNNLRDAYQCRLMYEDLITIFFCDFKFYSSIISYYFFPESMG